VSNANCNKLNIVLGIWCPPSIFFHHPIADLASVMSEGSLRFWLLGFVLVGGIFGDKSPPFSFLLPSFFFGLKVEESAAA
jgi:hypothetical protein